MSPCCKDCYIWLRFLFNPEAGLLRADFERRMHGGAPEGDKAPPDKGAPSESSKPAVSQGLEEGEGEEEEPLAIDPPADMVEEQPEQPDESQPDAQDVSWITWGPQGAKFWFWTFGSQLWHLAVESSIRSGLAFSPFLP